MNHLPRLYTLQEAAMALRIHESTLDREIRDGRLNCTRIRRRVFVTADQLNEYINNQGRSPWKAGSSNTATIGSSNDQIHQTSSSTGASQEHDVCSKRAHEHPVSRPPGRPWFDSFIDTTGPNESDPTGSS